MSLGDKTRDWVMSLPCDMWHVSRVGGWRGAQLSGGNVRLIPRPRELWSVNTHKAIHHQEQGPGYFLNNSWIFSAVEITRPQRVGGDTTHNVSECHTGPVSAEPTQLQVKVTRLARAPGPPGTVSMSAHRDFVWRSAFTAHKTFIFQAFYICGQYMRCINRKAWKWIIRIHFRNTGHFQEKKVESMRHESKFYGMKV